MNYKLRDIFAMVMLSGIFSSGTVPQSATDVELPFCAKRYNVTWGTLPLPFRK